MKQVILNPLPAPLALTYYIPELGADPSTPSAGDSWVLRQGSGGSGGGKIRAFIGLSLAYLTVNTGSSFSYKFSYQTSAGTTKRVTLS